MKKKKRVTRKELLKEPDKVLTFSGALMMRIMEHKKQLAVVTGVFFALAIAVVLVRYVSEKNEGKAFVMLENSMVRYEKLAGEKGHEAAYREMQPDFQRLVDTYPDKIAGKFGRIVYANMSYRAGDAQNAINLYEAALLDFEANPAFHNLILSGLGYAYEKTDDWNKAAGQFEKIANGPDALMKDEAYFNLGRIYSKMGDKEKSTTAFRKILTDFTDSVYYDMVKDTVAG